MFFKPSRSVYKFKNGEEALAALDAVAKDGPKKPKEGKKGKEKAPATPNPYEGAIKKAKYREYQLSGEVKKQVTEKLKSHAEGVSNFLNSRSAYEKKDKTKNWRKWNEDFAKAMGIEGDPKAFIRGLQEVVFRAEGLKGDRAAKPDGRFGPYTAAALAHYFGSGADLPIPDAGKNPRLAERQRVKEGKKVAEGSQKQIEIAEKVDDLMKYSDNIYQDYVDALGRYHQANTPVDKAAFMSVLPTLLAASGGDIDSTNFDQWRDAISMADLSGQQLGELGLERKDTRTASGVAKRVSESGEVEELPNPYNKPDPGVAWNAEQLVAYYSAQPGHEPQGGPQLPNSWFEENNVSMSSLPEMVDAPAAEVADVSTVGEGFKMPSNPYSKPHPGHGWSDEALEQYYNSAPGFEPGGGPQLPDQWFAENMGSVNPETDEPTV